ETIETINLTTNQSLDNFSFTTNSILSNLPVSNNNKIVEIEAPVTIEDPATKTLD
ncbi:16473_t:CDS:1, partial [Gigaspora margarita]